MFDVLTLDVLKIDLIILFRFIEHVISVCLLSIDVVALSSFMCSIWILISIRDLRFFIVVILPSCFSLILFLFLIFLFVLLNLILVHFNIIASILCWNIRIGRLFSSVMKSCFLLNGLFLIFELLLGLIIEIDLCLFLWNLWFLVTCHKIVRFGFTIVVFDFSSYFRMVNAFKILLNRLFAILRV